MTTFTQRAEPRAASHAVNDGSTYRLSRHLQLRPEREGFVVESLITGHREYLPNPTVQRLFLSFAAATNVGDLLRPLDERSQSLLRTFLSRCLHGGLLTQIDDDGTAREDRIRSLEHWEPHDLAFHLRSRRGRNPSPVGATWRLASKVPPEPTRRPANAGTLGLVHLSTPDLEQLREHDLPLTRVLESRRSRYSIEPVSLQALSALLFRACRVTDVVGTKKMVRKVYPSGGSLHSLEVYVVAHRCLGLERGGYRYDPFDHRLEWLRRDDPELTELLREAQQGTRQLAGLPSVLLIFASRFRRVTRKYQSLAYRVILQEVGALYQTLYLTAEAADLAVSAIGAGDSDRFARVFQTDFFAESSVGEMIVGGRAIA